jgi:hypothetical protein
MKLLTASVAPFLLLSPVCCLLARSPLTFVATSNAISHAKFHATSNSMSKSESKHVETILFVECGSFHTCGLVVCCDQAISWRIVPCLAHIINAQPPGFGSDAHGQNSTKAAGANHRHVRKYVPILHLSILAVSSADLDTIWTVNTDLPSLTLRKFALAEMPLSSTRFHLSPKLYLGEEMQ